MNSRKIIYAFVVLMLVFSIYLSYLGKKQTDYNYQSKWWTVYFADPKNDSFDFTIENHSKASDFHWEIKTNNQIVSSENIMLQTGENKTIQLPIPNQKGKIIISVMTGTDKKEIYKIIN